MDITLRNTANPRISVFVKALVNTGTTHSMVPEYIAELLDVKTKNVISFVKRANGTFSQFPRTSGITFSLNKENEVQSFALVGGDKVVVGWHELIDFGIISKLQRA